MRSDRLILPDLVARHRQPELIDAQDLPSERHEGALRALARVNALSRAAPRIWREIRRLTEADALGRIRVLDVACGGGDVAVALARRAARSGVDLEVHGCDVSPTALDFARKNAERAGVQAHFFQLDALRGEIPDGYDVVCSSLFLHHLDDDAAVALLAAMAEKASRMVLVQDLRRTIVGYVLAYGTLRVISRSHVAHTDGPRSVEGAFSLEEAAELASRAGLQGARVEPCWPQRFQLIWRHA